MAGKPSKRKTEAEDEEPEEDVEEEEEEEEEKPAEKPTPKKRKKAEPKAKKGEDDDGKKKKKKKKDKNAPKRGLSAYLIFSNDHREEVKTDNPGIAFTEIPKKIAEKWKLLTAEDKIPYDERAKLDKARYEKEMEAYVAKLEAAPAADEDDE